MQSASIFVRILIFCASVQTTTTVRSLQLCTSGTHLNLASGNWHFQCRTLRWKCCLTSSEVFVWTWTDTVAEDTSEFTMILLLAVRSSNGSRTTCLRQYITTTTMFHWWGGMLWILSTFFLSPYLSLIILVQDGLCLICQHNVISLSFRSLFFFVKQSWPGFEAYRWHSGNAFCYLLTLAQTHLPSGSGQRGWEGGFSWLPLLSPTLVPLL